MRTFLCVLLFMTISWAAGPVNPTIMNNPNGNIVYLIWYGNFQTWPNSNSVAVIENLVSHIGGTSRFAMNALRADANGRHVVNKLTFGGSYFDSAMSQGASLSGTSGYGNDGSYKAAVEHAINTAGWPRVSNAIYFLIASGANVSDNVNHSTTLAEHAAYVDGLGNRIVMAYQTPVASGPCIGSPPCLNSDWWSDYTGQAITHEIEEAIADPYPTLGISGWGEPDDLCAYFSNLSFTAPNGAAYTMQLGQYYYKIYAQSGVFGKLTGHSYCYDAPPGPLSPDGYSVQIRGAATLRGAASLSGN